MINIYKKIIFFLILTLPFNVYGESKLAYLDFDNLLLKINAGNVIFKKLEDNENIKKQEFLEKEKKLKDEENKILASRNIISAEQLDINIKEFQNKLRDYSQFNSKELEK